MTRTTLEGWPSERAKLPVAIGVDGHSGKTLTSIWIAAAVLSLDDQAG